MLVIVFIWLLKNILETLSLKENSNEYSGIVIEVLSDYSQLGKNVCNKLQETDEIKIHSDKIKFILFSWKMSSFIPDDPLVRIEIEIKRNV